MAGSVSIRRLPACFTVLGLGVVLGSAPVAFSQGFGTSKNKVMLHRKLPSVAYEALAYGSEDSKAATKYLREAAINLEPPPEDADKNKQPNPTQTPIQNSKSGARSRTHIALERVFHLPFLTS